MKWLFWIRKNGGIRAHPRADQRFSLYAVTECIACDSFYIGNKEIVKILYIILQLWDEFMRQSAEHVSDVLLRQDHRAPVTLADTRRWPD